MHFIVKKIFVQVCKFVRIRLVGFCFETETEDVN